MMDKKRGQIRALFAAAVLLASLTAPRAEDKFSAGEMLSNCQAIEDSAKTAKNLDEIELDNTFTSGTCWGAFLSIQQFIVTKVEGGKTAILQICTPPETTLVQIIQIFDLFVRSNPKRQDEPFTKVAIAALRSAYPCK
jgi:Rap1a immunity proteins